ncbi:MAG: ABC transporter substrate-binding protein [Chitinophagales bacterium]|nr:ABC transporter substrate-binding protein [Chitinophagales bacterium]
MNSLQFIDQLHRTVEITFPPQKIISLVPSQTELLVDLGLEENIVGITKFCVHPPHLLKTKPKVGGTKNLRLDKIRSLQPDIIIANKEENSKEQIDELEKYFPVWISDVKNFEDSLKMITSVGEFTGTSNIASQIILRIRKEKMQLVAIDPKHFNTVYLIWKDPWMTVGGDTFIHTMIETAGFENMCKHQMRYPVLSDSQLTTLNPEVILLSSEPYPFKEKNVKELQELLPGAKVVLVDGEMFSWYGSRMQFSFTYFHELKKRVNN